MKNDGTKTARMQNIESRRAMAVRVQASTTARARETPGSMLGVDVLDLDGGFVHQDADGERESAERHDVDGLPGGPQQNHRAQQRERNVEHDDQRAAPVAQEDQHHQAGERRAEQPFHHQPADGVA